MINKKVNYINIVFLIFILFYIGIYLFALDSTLSIVQGSEGIESAKAGIIRYEIISEHNNHYTGIVSPVVIMGLILCIEILFFKKSRQNKLAIFNILALILSIILYSIFISNLFYNIELSVAHENFVFKNANLYSYEFIDIIEKDGMGKIANSSLEKELNLSLISLVILLIVNVLNLSRAKYPLQKPSN